uniref:RING-type E3 ubiquitin transferase n=1 Tax=Lepisosteus oculatus TaxID=7918 RepID=W5LXN3_LEPOC
RACFSAGLSFLSAPALMASIALPLSAPPNSVADILTRDSGECSICLEDLLQGQTISRLACLCVYHKSCIDSWCKVKSCCPEHPFD